MFKKPFSFEGRIRRTEYGLSNLISFGAMMIIIPVVMQGLSFDNVLVTFLSLSLFVPILWFLFAQSAKRCHDLENSGWFQFVPLYRFGCFL